ncbi:pentapeptide repeat-containing protein [Streptomyces sp. NPDC056401]|uniref:pentapeptide repeat-containing protein n=1 Tax=Streptomyces sp. NPDC056401 TaxID=3345809 RepID=UPI0035DE57A8
MASLPGLVALVALLFTWVSVGQTGTELRIAEQGQITTRFNAAVSHLGSQSMDLRFGGIYALERIMQDSTRDQPRVISVLSAYVRTHNPVPVGGFPEMEGALVRKLLPKADVVAAIDVLAQRSPGRDGRARVDWQRADLRLLDLGWRQAAAGRWVQQPDRSSNSRPYLPFSFADLTGADLRYSIFLRVDLHGASCGGVNMAHARFIDVNLDGASLGSADLTQAELKQTSLRNAYLLRAVLAGASLIGADLREAALGSVDAHDVSLSLADLRNADLRRANLSDADLEEANLRDANLAGANLRNANLHLADLTGADLKDADLTGANLEQTAGVPADLRQK